MEPFLHYPDLTNVFSFLLIPLREAIDKKRTFDVQLCKFLRTAILNR